MKNSNRNLIITAIVLLTVIVVLLSGILLFAIFNGGGFMLNYGSKNQTVFDESFDTADVSKITVNSSFGDINIKKSDTDKIRVFTKDGNEEYFSAVIKDGVIEVENKQKNEGRVKLNSLFGKSNASSDIDIYVPENCIDRIEIYSDFGDVEIGSLNNISLKVDCSYGNIEADYLGGDFNLNTDMGNVEIDRINISKDSSAISSMGNIEIDDTNDVKIDYEASMGKCTIKHNNLSSSVTLTAKTSMGDVEIG